MESLHASVGRWLYFAMAIILFVLAMVLLNFYKGNLQPEHARVYIETMQVIATLALLYFAYRAFAGAQQKSIATAELAVRPDLNWELLQEKGKIFLRYFSCEHPTYDLELELKAGNRKQTIKERHLDIHEPDTPHIYTKDITRFITKSIKGKNKLRLDILLTYHSEVGGRYEAAFTKEIIKKDGRYDFKHRKILWASYPWSEKIIRFD